MNAVRFFAWSVVLLSGSLLLGQAPDGKPTDIAPALKPGGGKVTPDKTPAKAEKRVAFEMRDKPWVQVIEWLVDQTGMKYIAEYNPPTSSFSFISPKGATYTIPEVIDIINAGLRQKQFILVRGNYDTFTIVPADQAINSENVPRIALTELEDRGRSEVVSLVLTLKELNADEFAPTVKKQMSSFGSVIPLTASNQLILQDQAGTLRRIIKDIQDNEKDENGVRETYAHKCLYVKAAQAERVLREFLGSNEANVVKIQGNPGGGGGNPFGMGGGGGNPFGMGGGGGGPGGGNPFGMGGGGGGPGFNRGGGNGDVQRPATRVVMHSITSDEASNTVFVNGRADKIAQARSVMAKLDVPRNAQQQPFDPSPPIMHTYNVPAGNADALVKILSDLPDYRPSNSFKMSAISPTQIMVWGNPTVQMDVARHLQFPKGPEIVTETVQLSLLEALKTAELLKGMFPGDAKAGAPFIESDASRNVIILRGSSQQIGEIKLAIQAIGDTVGGGGSMRIVTLEKGSAATLAEALQRIIPALRDNPVKIHRLGNDDMYNVPPPGATPSIPPLAPAPTLVPEPKKVGSLSTVSFQQDGVLVDPAAGAQKDVKPAGKALNITAFGNKLILTSDDPAALALAHELIRLYTKVDYGEGDFEVIRLKNAGATEIARIIDEAFNGPKGGQGGGGGPKQGGGFNPANLIQGMFQNALGGGGPQQRVDRVRVVADPASNSLLIRSTPLDMMTIRSILGKALDAGNTDSNALAKTWMIGPLKHANVNEVAQIVSNVYRQNLNAGNRQVNMGGPQGFGGGFPFGMPQQQQQPQQPNNTPQLSLGVDDRSNSLIVSCAKPLYDDIYKLTNMLEEKAADNKQLIRVVQIKGVDPVIVEQALAAIQGQPRRPATGQQGMGQGQGGGQGFGGNQGFGGGQGQGFGNQGFGNPGFGQGNFNPVFGVGQNQLGGGLQFNPGGGGGPGFVVPGGGGFGGGKGGGGGGGKGKTNLRGPDFFDSSVMDDHQTPALFDPASIGGDAGIAQASYQEGQGVPGKELPNQKGVPIPFEPAKLPPGPNDNIVAPRLPVQVESLGELGALIVRARNAEDLKAAIDLIELILSQTNASQIEIEIVALQKADPTSVVNSMNLLLQRFNFSPNATTPILGGVRSGTTVAPTQTAPGLGVLGAQGQQGGGITAQQITNQPLNSSVVLIALPRLSSIMVATYKSRMAEIKDRIRKFDVDWAGDAGSIQIRLKNQSATRVATLIQTFFASRFPQEAQGQNQVRITADENTNSLIVQASPADLIEIRRLVDQLDNNFPASTNDLRIVPLRNALAEDTALLVTRAISEGQTPVNVNAGGLPGAGGPAGQAGQAAPLVGQNTNLTTGTTRATKVSSLRLFTSERFGGRKLESGVLDDIRITADSRTNILMVQAPAGTMELILALIRELDIIPNARAQVNVFQLKKADAYNMALTLQQLFQGTGATKPATGATGPIAAAPGGATTGRPALMLSLSGIGPDGAPLIDLRVTIDERTNSLIAAGSASDLAIIEALIARLDDADIGFRRNEAFRLRNAQAADIAASIADFMTKQLAAKTKGNLLTPYQEAQQDVIVVAEPLSNTLLISATPQYMDEILRMISQIDTMPPQVAVTVLIAEVDLANSNEFGVELGFQSPVLFRRGLSADGTTATPGFPFNTTVLGNNPVQSPGVVGYQGISSLGVGRSSPRNNVGGLVFSASSDSVNVLVRALQVQGRIDIISRPQIIITENQTGIINVGKDVPVLSSSNVTATGIVTTNIDRKTIGVIMQVTPRVTPEGRVLMRVIPEVSSIDNQNFPLGNGTSSTSFNLQHLETTISAYDGETVILGGLISSRDEKNENKVPWLGDVPYVGSLFRYRSQYKTKTELLIIMTPHIIRNKADGERVLAEEARKMDWVLPTILKSQGPRSLNFPASSEGNLAPFATPTFGGPQFGMPQGNSIFSGPPTILDEGPQPRVMPGTGSGVPGNVAPMAPPQSAVPQQMPPSAAVNQVPNGQAFPAEVPNGVPVQRLNQSSAVVPVDANSQPRRGIASLIPNFNRGTTPAAQTIPTASPTMEGTR